MLRGFSASYAGHIVEDSLGFQGTPANDRWYPNAKLAETFDAQIYGLTAHAVSGHTLKHLLAAASAAVLLAWRGARMRAPVPGN